MADSTLVANTALGNVNPVSMNIGNATLTEIASSSIASLAMRDGNEKAFHKSAKTTLGLKLPDPNKSAASEVFSAIWTGADQWLICSSESGHEDLAAHLKDSFGDTASITEQTGAWCEFTLEGDPANHILQRLCAVDVDMMNAGDATRTVMEHVGVVLICEESRSKYRILGPSSYAGSLYHSLQTAATSVQLISML